MKRRTRQKEKQQKQGRNDDITSRQILAKVDRMHVWSCFRFARENGIRKRACVAMRYSRSSPPERENRDWPCEIQKKLRC